MTDKEPARHWADDPFWTTALDSYFELRNSGKREITLNLDTIENEIFNGDSVAYKLMTAMQGVLEHEQWDGCKGAPRVLLATLVRLHELSQDGGREPDR